MLTETDTDYAPWTVVEAHDRRFATSQDFRYRDRRAGAGRRGRGPEGRRPADAAFPAGPGDQYLQDERARPRGPVPVVNPRGVRYPAEEGPGEASRAGARDLPAARARCHRVRGLGRGRQGGQYPPADAKPGSAGYEVVPVAAPNDVEKAHHYLWRFWAQMPKAGHITIFDRTWYGRVLVERVEGFCTEAQWRRAYREINGMEQQLAHFGTVLLKFWLHIDPDEQLRRFRERQEMAHKQWKITDEDWRNREKLDQYRDAVEEMLHRTTTPYAPWTIVESNCKRYARVKVLETVCEAIRQRLE